MAPSAQVTADAIRKMAHDIGYVACGITSAAPFEEYAKALAERIRIFPESAELYRKMLGNIDPTAKAPWAKSIVVCLRWYGKYELPAEAVGHIGRAYLADRRFAECPDNGMPSRMKAGLAGMGLRVRTGGAPCRPAAIRSGIAQQARNCFAWTPEYGSWINIECWLVDAVLPEDKPSNSCPCPDGCRACIDACPTRALESPYLMRMDKCVAYLSFGAPAPIEPSLASRMGKWIYGCDACQEACPINKGKWKNNEKADWMFRVAGHLSPGAIATMSPETFEKVINPRFPYIPVSDLARWRTNASRLV